MADDFISDEDKALFRELMRSVKPLHEKTQKVKAKTPTFAPLEKPLRKKIPEPVIYKDNYLSDFIRDTVLSNTLLSYSIQSLPSKRFRELKNGQIPWEARLDLHGLKAQDARHALFQFINSQTQQGKHCVLIIHGKGGHLGAPPVIKNLVNRWLPQFDQILAFHSAKAKDGGQGAVYVLLKK